MRARFQAPGVQVVALFSPEHGLVGGKDENVASSKDAASGLPVFYVGDMAQPRGGPLPFGHASHQTGLDVDIWFTLTPRPRLVPAARFGLDSDRGSSIDLVNECSRTSLQRLFCTTTTLARPWTPRPG